MTKDESLANGLRERAQTIETTDVKSALLMRQAANKIAAIGREAGPVAWQWRALEDDDPRTQWYPLERGDLASWEALALRDPSKFRVEKRPLYLARQGGVK